MRIIKLFQSMMMVLGIVVLGQVATVTSANAAGSDVLTESCNVNGGSSSALCAPSDKLFGPNSIWTKVVNTLIYVAGAAAVIMIVVGGFRYVISGGDSGQLNSAKNTILYSVVGLVIAIASYSIVNFVLARF